LIDHGLRSVRTDQFEDFIAAEVGRILAIGFADDPVLTWVFPEPEHAAKLARFFGFLAVVDGARLTAYLESTDPRNLPLYQRHGFATTGLIELPNGPTLTQMWRDPRSD